MADNTIDTLALEVSSNAGRAVGSINKLAESLGKVGQSLGLINTTQFHDLADGIDVLSKSMLNFSKTVKTADFTRVANGLNKISAVNASQIIYASTAIKTLGNEMQTLSSMNVDSKNFIELANAVSKMGRKTVTQAVTNIPQLTKQISKLQGAMSGISQANYDVSSLTSLTSAISKLGGKSALAAPENIQKLAVALKDMMKTLSTAPQVSQNLINMTNALASLASNGNRTASASRSLVTSLGNYGSYTKRARSHTFSLASALGKLYASYWLIIRAMGLFKKSIDISADLTEVQNVVNQTFGDFASKIEDLSQNSIQNLGMSELTVKQISSRYQAMGVAMGFTQGKMSDMSVELTKLAADMASFYNVEQAVVAEDLEAVFTGATRPLRQYGLDLTQATLQEWALKNGIDANIQSMSQAEKTMLRYQYVMAQTKLVSGDFAETANTWSNQVRILKQSFEALGGIIGGTLISAFKPFLSALNTVMQKVIAFARTVANALGAIFGWTIEIDAGGIASDFEAAEDSLGGAADTSGGVADNIKDANKNAEKLKKTVMSFDQLHQLADITSNTSSGAGSGGSGGGGGGGGSADGATAQLVRRDSLFEQYKSEIKSLEQLGEYIGNALTKAMDSINWGKVYLKAAKFGTGLASFLNGLISPELFGSTARTIAGALNTALYALSGFGREFDWNDFGISIAEGINKFFKTFRFSVLAQNINTWAHGILDTMIAAVDGVNWGEIGREIGEFLSQIDWGGILKKIGKLIWTALTGALKAWQMSFDASPIETGVLAGIALLKFAGLKETLLALLKSKLFGSNAAFNLGTAKLNFSASLGNVAGIATIGMGITKLISSSIQDKDTAKIVERIGVGMSTGVAIGKLGGPIGIIAGGLIGGLAGYVSDPANWETFTNNLKDALNLAIAPVQKLFNYLEEKGIATTEVNPFGVFIVALQELESEAGLAAGSFQGLYDTLDNAEYTGRPISELKADIIKQLSEMEISSENFGDAFFSAMLKVGLSSKEQAAVLGMLGGDFADLAENATYASTNLNGVSGVLSILSSSSLKPEEKVALISSALNSLQEKAGLSDTEIGSLNGMLEQAGTSGAGLDILFYKIANRLDLASINAGDMYSALESGSSSVATAIPEDMATVLESINAFVTGVETDMETAGGAFTDGMKNGIDGGKQDVVDAAGEVAESVNTAVREGWDEHSPSKIAEGYAKNYDQGLANGLANNVALVTTACNTIVTSVKKKFGDQSLYALFQYYGGQYMTYLKTGLSTGDDKVLTEAGNIAESIKKKFSSASAYSGYGSNYMNSLKNGLSSGASGKNGLYTTAKSIANSVMSKFSMYDSMYSRGQNAAKGFRAGMTSIRIPTPHIVPTGNMKYVLGNSSFSIPTWGVNWYKRGGLFDAASIIGVGEAGREAVLPLENRKTMRMIADSITENSSGIGSAQIIADAVERGVVTAMMNNAHNQQPVNVHATLYTENNEVLARAVAKGQRSIDYRNNPVPSY